MRTRWVFGLAVMAAIVGSIVLFRHEVARVAIVTGARLAAGYDVTIGQQHVGIAGASFYNVHASRNGLPLLTISRVDVRYSLRDLLPGSNRRFGLVSITLIEPHVSIDRFKDGTFNFTSPQPARSPITPPQRPRLNSVPWRLAVHVRAGSLELLEPAANDRLARDIPVRGFDGDAHVDSAKRTQYSARGSFAAAPDEPFTLAGTIDAIRGFAVHRARAARIPLRALANYFTDTPAVRVLSGQARDFDARLYALEVEPNVGLDYHAALSVDIDDTSLSLPALDLPIRSIDGRLQLIDSTVFFRHMHASVAGMRLHLAGSIYDLLGARNGEPQLRLGIYGTGDLADIRRDFAATRTQPISGAAELGVLVEGALQNPSIVARLTSPRAFYRSVGFDALDAHVVYRDGVAALLPLRGYYRSTQITVRGALTIGKVLHTNVAVHVAGTADRLPYLDELLGPEPIVLDAVATGDDNRFSAHGNAASALTASRVAAMFALHPNGTAVIEPFWLHTDRGSFDGAYVLDRPRATSAFWAFASGVRMHLPVSGAGFADLGLPSIPPIDGHIDRVAVAGGGSGRQIALAGDMSAHDTRIAGVAFDTLSAAFGGTLANANIGLLHASGPWGRFQGHGAFSSQAMVAAGAYRGRLEGLQPYLTSAIPAFGPIAGKVAVSVASGRIVVQGTDLAMPGASLRGIPVSSASLTLAIEKSLLRVYSARASAAGGEVTAAGTFSLAGVPQRYETHALSLVADRLDAEQLHSLGLPLSGGQLWAVGNLRAGASLPGFDGGITLAEGTVHHYPVSGGGEVALAGDTATLRHVIGGVGPAYGLVDGRIGALASGSPSYALGVDVPAAGVATMLQALRVTPPYPMDGTFNASVRLGGRGASLTIDGDVNVPAGIINGLPFSDGTSVVAVNRYGGSVRKGSVTVATTNAHFDVVSHGKETSLDVSSGRATLSDFNNFFDTGDTLSGRGPLRFFAALYGGQRLSTNGALDVAGLRYRNLPFGHTAGAWSSDGNNVAASLSVAGSYGTLRASGGMDVVPAADVRSTLERSRYDLSGSIAHLDLSLWVPALGLTSVPITGFGDASASLHGTFPALSVRGSAAIEHGTVGPLRLDAANIAVHSSHSRIAIDSAQVLSTGLAATASGSFGLRPYDPLDVQVHATTNDLPRLVHQLAGVQIPVTGDFASTLRIAGSVRAPTFTAGLDATGVKAYGIGIETLFGEVRLHGKTIVLSNAGATFASGEATLAGFVPLRLSPLALGAPGEAVSFDADVTDLDPAIFDQALGNNTKLGGTINGHFGLSGSIGNPLVIGHATLEKGSYVSDLQREPITGARAQLRFDHTTAALDGVYAKVGGGTLDGSGRFDFPHGFSTGSGYTIAANAVARRARLDLPAYGSGTIDGEAALTKNATTKALLSGDVTLSSATLGLSAFLQAGGGGGTGFAPPPLALDFHAAAGRGVRVRGRGYGAAVDIGLAGALHVQGTLASPTLEGRITSTGGTVTYFDRAFRVTEGSAAFDGTGVAPTLHAVATTSVFRPDVSASRNGSVAITITAQGQIDRLNVEFVTNPPGFSTNETLAMLAPFGGLINYGAPGQQPGLAQTPGGLAPIGPTQPLPVGVTQTSSNSVTVGREAFNLLNTRFSSALFGPLETALSEGLGLSSVNLTLGYYGNVEFSASRPLGDKVTAFYSASIGVPQVQTFGLRYNPSAYTSATLSFFYQTGAQRVLEQPIYAIGNASQLLLGQPILGTSGFDFLLQRHL